MKVKLEAGAQMPKKAHRTDAAFDLYAYEDSVIFPYHRGTLRTGVRMEIPRGFYGDIRPRSSAFLKGFNVSGVIDSGYRGEVMVMVQNNSGLYYRIKKGDRIAQMIIAPAYDMILEEVDELSESDRGEHGFGSSGT